MDKAKVTIRVNQPINVSLPGEEGEHYGTVERVLKTGLSTEVTIRTSDGILVLELINQDDYP